MKPWLFALVNGRRLRSQTFTGPGLFGWTVPPGVASVNLSGHGQDGTPEGAGEDLLSIFNSRSCNFPGGAVGSFAPVTTYANVVVVPDQSETMQIPAGGAITITWYQ